MKHHLACNGTVTYTVIAINETEQARQCDNCGGFVVEPKPAAADHFQNYLAQVAAYLGLSVEDFMSFHGQVREAYDEGAGVSEAADEIRGWI